MFLPIKLPEFPSIFSAGSENSNRQESFYKTLYRVGFSPSLSTDHRLSPTFLGGPVVVRGGGGGLGAGGCRAAGGSGTGAAGGAARAVLSPRHRARLQLGGPRVGRTRHRSADCSHLQETKKKCVNKKNKSLRNRPLQ